MTGFINNCKREYINQGPTPEMGDSQRGWAAASTAENPREDDVVATPELISLLCLDLVSALPRHFCLVSCDRFPSICVTTTVTSISIHNTR
jgi:hypothetical protein